MRAVVYTASRDSREVERTAHEKGIYVIKIYVEEEGKRRIIPLSRPEFSRAVRHVEQERIPLVVSSLADISDKTEHLISTVRYFLARGLELYFLDSYLISTVVNTVSDNDRKAICHAYLLGMVELYDRQIVKHKISLMEGLERARREGKRIGRPSLIHFIAMYLTGRTNMHFPTREEIERARKFLKQYISAKRSEGKSIREIYDEFLRDFNMVWRLYPSAPRSLTAFYRLYRDVMLS